jgi:hypothetical protein
MLPPPDDQSFFSNMDKGSFPPSLFNEEGKIFSCKLSSFISSYIAVRLAIEDNNLPNVISYIVPFSSKSALFCYLNWKVYENQSLSMQYLSGDSITKKDLNAMTREEIVAKLRSESKVEWEDVPRRDKYGSFYKLGEGKKKKKAVIEKCFFPTFVNYEKYMKFFFG